MTSQHKFINYTRKIVQNLFLEDLFSSVTSEFPVNTNDKAAKLIFQDDIGIIDHYIYYIYQRYIFQCI